MMHDIHYEANLLGAFTMRVADAVDVVVSDAVGVRGSGASALIAIDTWPGCTISFLRDVLALTHSGTVRTVDTLQREGLVQRGPGSDGRSVALRVTRKGGTRVARARRERQRLLAELVEDLDVGERGALRRILLKALGRSGITRTEARHACRICDHTSCRGEECPVGSAVEDR